MKPKSYWFPYLDNWQSCERGDKIVTVNTEDTTYMLDMVYAGEVKKWKVVENIGCALKVKRDGEMLYLSNIGVDENGIYVINLMYAKMKLQLYVEKKASWCTRFKRWWNENV